MKIYTDGSKGQSCQLDRIEQGFIELGYEATDFISCADLIFSNNPSPTRTQIVKDRKEGKLKDGVKLIFNVLDVPMHLWETESFQNEVPQIKSDLAAADAVTSISEYTQRMVREKYGFESTVIYNPMKEIHNEFKGERIQQKAYPIIHVGRRYDENKNFKSVIQSLQMLGANPAHLGLVGSECVGFGECLGVLNDTELNNQYFLSDFTFSLGTVEGISLTIPEAIAAKSIPIIHNRLTTREELLPSELFPEYNEINVDNPETIAKFILSFYQGDWKKEEFKERLYHHYLNNLKDKFDKVKVAERIIEVYRKL